MVQHINGVAGIGIHRVIERNRLYNRFQCHNDLAFGNAHLLGNFLDLGFAPVLVYKRLFNLHGAIGNVTHGTAYANGVAVPQKTADFADYHGHAIGGKAHIKVRVKVVDGFDKPDASHLKKVIRILPARCKFLHNTEHQPQITVNHCFPGGFVAGFCTPQQFHFFAFGEHRQLCSIYSANINFTVIHKSTFLFSFRSTVIMGF